MKRTYVKADPSELIDLDDAENLGWAGCVLIVALIAIGLFCIVAVVSQL